MKHRSTFFLVLIAGLTLSACSPVAVSYDMDKNVDFTKFKTYAYTAETAKLPVDDLNRNRITTAVDKEMSARGFSKSDSSPDVLIDLQIKAKEKQEAYTSGGAYGYRWGGGMQTTTISSYVEGTLFVNMISQNNLVWQGRATKTLDENASPEKRDANIKFAMSEIFKKYPIKPVAK